MRSIHLGLFDRSIVRGGLQSDSAFLALILVTPMTRGSACQAARHTAQSIEFLTTAYIDQETEF